MKLSFLGGKLNKFTPDIFSLLYPNNSKIIELDYRADWILKQLVIIYSIAPILQMKDQFSWTLLQE